MAVQFIPLALWGYRAYRGYRAVQAARRLAEAAEQALATAAAPAAAATAGITAAQNIEQAEEQADTDERTTSDWCATCEDPDCRDKGEQIRQRVNELRNRANDMLRDENNLFQNHYETADALFVPDASRASGWRKIGSWVGHLQQYDGKQRNLAKLMEEYKDLGCPTMEGDEVEDWATRPPPDGPATG